jgi:hypothetical protein
VPKLFVAALGLTRFPPKFLGTLADTFFAISHQ